MKIHRLPVLRTLALLACNLIAIHETAHAALTTNSWKPLLTGKWENGANWSTSSPSQIDAVDVITNGGMSPLFNKTIFIDATTALSNATMTVSNVLMTAPGIVVNKLVLTNVGPTAFTILNSLSVSNDTFVEVSNSILRVGSQLFDDGNVQLMGGSLITTGAVANIGHARAGRLTVNDGTWLGGSFTVGNLTGSSGTLNWAGGTNFIKTAAISIGFNVSATGTVWITGGSTALSNSVLTVGNGGVGQVTMSNGVLQVLGSLSTIGNVAGSQGTLTMAGGTNLITSPLLIGNGIAATGAVWMTGGLLVVTNGTTTIGSFGIAQMVVSNGNWLARDLDLGAGPVSQGALTLAGGTNACTGPVIIGPGGMLTVKNGGLVVTNTPANVVVTNLNLTVDGTVVLTNGGSLVATDNFLTTYIGYHGRGTLTNLGGALRVADLQIGELPGSSGTFTMSGGTSEVGSNVSLSGFSNLNLGGSLGATGTLWITGGQLTTTGGYVAVGEYGVGQATISNGNWLADPVTILIPYQPLSQGTLTIAGGTFSSSGLLVGWSPNTTGTVWMTGGSVWAYGTQIGEGGVGRMTMSNGTWQGLEVLVGFGGSGTFNMAGGTISLAQDFIDGYSPGIGAGFAWITGGQLSTALYINIGETGGAGQMIVSNGTVTTWILRLGFGTYLVPAKGTLISAGGAITVTTNLVIGDGNCFDVGTLTMAGGSVSVTNSSASGVLEVHNGTLEIDSGTLWIDKLVMTNACGRFVRTGGIFIMNTLPLLGPDLDADGDGLPNQWEQIHGLDALSTNGNNGAEGDPDHDGFTNLEEYQAGTDPQDPNSNPLRITSIAKQGSDVLVTWLTAAGKSNLIQSTKGTANGSYSNNFADLSPVIIVPGLGLVTTNYLDVGGATNKPARYYRIRLMP